MGNRYTRTSMTKRQIESIKVAKMKILTVALDRQEIFARSNNENEYVIMLLTDVVKKINEAIDTAKEWVNQ